MRVLIRNTALNGRPLEGDGEVFSGEMVMDVVLAAYSVEPFEFVAQERKGAEP